MNTKTKWELRQTAISIYTLPMSLTFIVFLICAIKTYKFYSYGLSIYPEVDWPKTVPIPELLQFHWKASLAPVLSWLFVTLPVDVVLRRYFYGIRD